MSGIRVTCCPHATMASMTDKTQITLTAPASVDLALVVGPDSTLRVVESAFEASITVRGDSIILAGDQSEVQSLTALFSDFIKIAERGEEVTPEYALRSIELLRSAEFSPQALREDILLTFRGRAIRPKTALRRRHPLPYHHVRARTCGNGQDLSRHGDGRRGA